MWNNPFLFAIVVLSLCSACGNSRDNTMESTSVSTATVAYEDRAPIIAKSKDGEGRTVAAEQNEIAAVETYRITDRSAGPFMIDAVIPEKLEGFDVTKSLEEKILPTCETREIPVYIYEIGNEGWVKVTPQHDATTGCTTGKTSEILIYSDLFLTDKGIGAMSSVEDFAAAYPDFIIRYVHDAELFVAETQELKNVQFIINNEYYCGDDATLASSESVEFQVSDFEKESYFTAIRTIE